MPGNRFSDDVKSDRTPFNLKADYTEVDHGFRKRLERMVPNDLSERINRVLARRMEEEPEKDAI
jgi:hypothetical protein